MRTGTGSSVRGCEASAAYRRIARARTYQIRTAFTSLHKDTECSRLLTMSREKAHTWPDAATATAARCPPRR
jgi:hypothetical protein